MNLRLHHGVTNCLQSGSGNVSSNKNPFYYFPAHNERKYLNVHQLCLLAMQNVKF